MFDQFTLGIEEEFQIVDPETRELRSHVAEILDEGRMLLGEQVKPEMIQSQIEVGTGVCKNIQEARADISNLRGIIASLAEKNGLKIVAASTHPISRWQDQKIFDDDRYELLIQELQTVARSLLIFGVHVHVGIADRERQIHIMNASRYFLPHVLALSTSSPFWMGHNTGLKSYRSEIFKQFPRTDIPDHFDSYPNFERYVNLLIKTGCINDGKKIWWDCRPHPFFPTLEFRICDIPTRVDDTVAIAAGVSATASCAGFLATVPNVGSTWTTTYGANGVNPTSPFTVSTSASQLAMVIPPGGSLCIQVTLTHNTGGKPSMVYDGTAGVGDTNFVPPSIVVPESLLGLVGLVVVVPLLVRRLVRRPR